MHCAVMDVYVMPACCARLHISRLPRSTSTAQIHTYQFFAAWQQTSALPAASGSPKRQGTLAEQARLQNRLCDLAGQHAVPRSRTRQQIRTSCQWWLALTSSICSHR